MSGQTRHFGDPRMSWPATAPTIRRGAGKGMWVTKPTINGGRVTVQQPPGNFAISTGN
jgi:hypothetical protein